MYDYCLLKDSNVEECEEFLNVLQKGTDSEWLVMHSKDNGKKGIIHYLRFIFFPLKVFIKRKKIKKLILSWQQYYGLIYAFYCKLFHVKKANSLIIMMFIYNPKNGLIGKIKFKFIKKIIRSKYIDKLVVTTSYEKKQYEELFESDKFCYINWGIKDEYRRNVEYNNFNSNYIVSIGRSNRDYNFLYDYAVNNKNLWFKIITDSYSKKLENFEVINNCYGVSMLKILSNAFCIIIPLEKCDVASGQLVLLQSMAIGVPVVISNFNVVRDYVDGENGLLFNKNLSDLDGCLKKLKNKDFYKKIVDNAYDRFINDFTIERMAKKYYDLISEVIHREDTIK